MLFIAVCLFWYLLGLESRRENVDLFFLSVSFCLVGEVPLFYVKESGSSSHEDGTRRAAQSGQSPPRAQPWRSQQPPLGGTWGCGVKCHVGGRGWEGGSSFSIAVSINTYFLVNAIYCRTLIMLLYRRWMIGFRCCKRRRFKYLCMQHTWLLFSNFYC